MSLGHNTDGYRGPPVPSTIFFIPVIHVWATPPTKPQYDVLCAKAPSNRSNQFWTETSQTVSQMQVFPFYKLPLVPVKD